MTGFGFPVAFANPIMALIDRPVYPTQQRPLQTLVNKLFMEAKPPAIDGEILALIVPDTNMISGGPIAAEVYKTLSGRHYETVVLVAPSHTGPFRRLSICSLDEYRTPLGALSVNDGVRNELCDEDDDIYLDDTGHFHTEGVDVQLPFLQTVLSGFDIVPIVMGEESPDYCRELGQAIGEVMYNRRTLVVAAADLLEADAEGLSLLHSHLEGMDVSRLMSLMNSETVRVEGKGTILAALIAALHRRANRARVLQLHAPHGEEMGYLGAVLYRG